MPFALISLLLGCFNLIQFEFILGIGIDDMFVIVQCLDNLDKQGDEDISYLVSMTMKHAGVAITITSITDVIVFAIGASSVSFLERCFFL